MAQTIKRCNELSSCTRVICCQGTIQLAAAIHVLLLRQQKIGSEEQQKVKNYLIVHDLFTQKNQEKPFFDIIRKMAEAMVKWEEVIYLEAKEIDNLERVYDKFGKIAFDEAVYKSIGILHADEIYISRNWQKGSIILLNIFEHATKICYGDSVGLYFPELYFSDKDWRTRFRLSFFGRILTQYRKKFRNAVYYSKRKPLFKNISHRNFDYGYLCFPEISGQAPPFEFERIPVSDLKTTFERFVDALPIELPVEIDVRRNLCVLLTSNFSEADRMSRRDELTSYVELVEVSVSEPATILIKPHPRDSKEKISLLKQKFLEKSFSVVVLDDPQHFYLPFEFFLFKFEKENPGIIHRMKFFTVSSACLSFWFLFNIKPTLGFGEERVTRYFRKDQIIGRVEHEKDLRLLMTS